MIRDVRSNRAVAVPNAGRAACPHAAAPWPKVRLRDISLGIYDGPHATPPPCEISDKYYLGIPHVTPKGLIDLSSPRYISDEDFPKWTRRVTPQAGDLIFSYEATLNLYAIIPKGLTCCLGRRMGLIRIDPNQVDGRYLYYYFFSDEWRNLIASKTIIGATVDRLPILTFPDFEVSLPPLPIQRRIASVLGAYDDLIENNRRRIALLEKMARELYRERFVRRAGKGNTVTLGEIATITMGQSPDSSGYNSEGRGLPFHQGATGFGNRFPKNEMWSTSGKRFAEAGDILFSVRAPVGRINIATEKIIMGRGVASLRQKEGLQNWFYYALKDYFSQEDMIGVGCVFASTTKDELHAVKMQMPPVSEISVFERLIRPIDDDLWNLTEQNRSLSRQRDRLLPRLMSGKIDVEALVKEEERHG